MGHIRSITRPKNGSLLLYRNQTTSIIGHQAYKEVREDRHPIIFFSGKDIADILTTNGFNTAKGVKAMLQNEFSMHGGR